MADKSAQVEVRGIRELASAFKQVDAALAGELKSRFLAVAQHVVDIARGKVPSRSGRAAASIKARGRASGASIAFGGTAAPYYPWLDFGGSVGRGHKPGVAWSGAIKRDWNVPGRYVYPAISEARPDTERAVELAVKEAAEGAGFETRGL